MAKLPTNIFAEIAAIIKCDFDSALWNAHLANIQDLLGVTTGDFASQFWSGWDTTWKLNGGHERAKLIASYIGAEIEIMI